MMTREETIGIELAVPDGWRRLVVEPDADGFAPLVLVPETWPEDWGFRPSIVVAAGAAETPPPSPQVVGSEAVAAALALEDRRVLAYDLWRDGAGRRLVFAYLEGPTAVSVVQHLVVHRSRRIAITSSADTDRWARVLPAIDEALDGLRLNEPSRDAT